ncbi:hypothetical protein DR950_17790 [Kitasatospora xanthocidica]|uniref:Uncharacterized protein n=1 Tax=Kitasatospora xanthocidica TaxID=83382 RepID=A0A372ZU03_9ACTN|nr:hypothetical protein [Kitasatospora xanthocidica]RGD59396.1 hypothetical protein DR950_17790 [Kitasatospora xanthocidica]
MLPTLIAVKDNQGCPTYAFDYSSILDPLVRTIATERAENEEVDHGLDQIATLAQSVNAAPDRDAADAPAAELSNRVDDFLDFLGHRRHELPAEPNQFDTRNARRLAAQLRAMAATLTTWSDRHSAEHAA